MTEVLFVILPVCFLEHRDGTGKNVAFKTNDYREAYHGCCYSAHAEMNMLSSIKPEFKRYKWFDLVVIRVNNEGKLRMSEPCAKCIKHLSRSNIKIKYVYYSNSDGGVTKVKFSTLKSRDVHHVTRSFR